MTIVRRLTAIFKDSLKGNFQKINFYLIENAKFLFYQLCLTFITAPILYHFDLLFFISIETNILDFVISKIQSQQYLKIGQLHLVIF